MTMRCDGFAVGDKVLYTGGKFPPVRPEFCLGQLLTVKGLNQQPGHGLTFEEDPEVGYTWAPEYFKVVERRADARNPREDKSANPFAVGDPVLVRGTVTAVGRGCGTPTSVEVGLTGVDLSITYQAAELRMDPHGGERPGVPAVPPPPFQVGDCIRGDSWSFPFYRVVDAGTLVEFGSHGQVYKIGIDFGMWQGKPMVEYHPAWPGRYRKVTPDARQGHAQGDTITNHVRWRKGSGPVIVLGFRDKVPGRYGDMEVLLPGTGKTFWVNSSGGASGAPWRAPEDTAGLRADALAWFKGQLPGDKAA